tara:strand:- start:206 stop:520 length:315 start_codon:yes stop_codon:yes gene_type:complete
MAKKRPNKVERERLKTIGEMPCYACFQDGREVQAEVHHIRKHTGMGLRPSHFDILPLCSVHHRTGKISVHLGKQAFVEKYGTEQQLQQRVRERIKQWNEIVDIF